MSSDEEEASHVIVVKVIFMLEFIRRVFSFSLIFGRLSVFEECLQGTWQKARMEGRDEGT